MDSVKLQLYFLMNNVTQELAHNVAAAWRSGGVSAKFGRELNFQNPAMCQTSHTPTDAKPLVIGWRLFIGF